MKHGQQFAAAIKIVARLRQQVCSLRERLAKIPEPFHDLLHVDVTGIEADSLLPHLAEAQSFEQIEWLLAELESTLKVLGFDMHPPRFADKEFWSIGSIELRDEPRSIHGGFLQPVLRRPIVKPVSGRTLAFLISIDNEKDLLKREHHDRVGWHYHYLDWKERRSNVVLCWEIRANPGGAHQPRPLLQEKHGEARKDFIARPELWGATKRASMYAACAPDLQKWPLSTFRLPGKKAVPVWPLNSALTPNTKPR